MSAVTPISMAARIRALARAAPAAPLVSMGAETLSRRAFDARSETIAHALVARGLVEGDLLTIALPNCVDFMVVAAACWKAGVTPQPVSWRLPEAELGAIVELARSPFVVANAGLVAPTPVLTVEDLLRGETADTPLADRLAPSWKAPTSGGSTGRPKLILSTTPSVYAPDASAFWRLDETDTALMPGPLYHSGPFMAASSAIMRGAHLVLMPKFDAEETLAIVATRRVTWLFVVPTMMGRICRLPDDVRARHDVSSLRTVWHFAAPCPAWLKRAWIDWLGPEVILEAYGATEGVAGTLITGADWLRKPGSVGRPYTGEIVIRDESGKECAPNEPGEVYLRPTPGTGPTYEYRGAESHVLPGGWETVGDIGWMDEDGYLFLGDRRADLILVGGSNVYPAEVEAAIEEYPDVRSVAVIGLPDDDLGEFVHAIVQADPAFDHAALQAHLARRLVRYKLPRTIEVVPFALRDDAGKVRRSQLRRERLPG